MREAVPVSLVKSGGDRCAGSFEETSLRARADAFAEKAHAGQVDKSGAPYIEHPRRVAQYLIEDFEDEVTVVIGLLHDVVEDTDVSLDDIELEFGTEVRLGVDAMTKRKGESLEDYCARVRLNERARAVKRKDVKDNTDPVRAALLDGKTRERLERKYAKTLSLLGED